MSAFEIIANQFIEQSKRFTQHARLSWFVYPWVWTVVINSAGDELWYASDNLDNIGQLHSFNQRPAVVRKDGTKIWYTIGKAVKVEKRRIPKICPLYIPVYK